MQNHILKSDAFNPWDELKNFEAQRFENQVGFGASAVFVGTMRDLNEGDDVASMFLEHYPGMTENYLRKIIQQAKSKWDLHECLLIHRTGEIFPADPIVLTAAWSSHRREALEACRFLIEELKHNAPFWKKETLTSGETRWVETNTPG